MVTTARKLALSLALLFGSVALLGASGWFGVGIPVGLILSILYWFDLAGELRNTRSSSRMLRIAGLLMGVPKALFGLLCAGIGISLIGWVFYNSFVERQPEYSGEFLRFGIGPMLVLFGVGWVVSAFRRQPLEEKAPDGAPKDS